MNRNIYRLISIFVTFVLVLGSSYSVGAAYGEQSSQSQVAALLAFPGAEGFGANSIGGRGGRIIEVENLNDSGAGSLRACVEASGARTCVFRTGGLIVLQSPLRIVNPYITIAGQTAPGGGITLKKAAGGDVFSTQTHDVVIRYLTSRPGSGGENHANQIAKNGAELYNIIIDHNSLSWGVDSNIETWYRVRDATIQWSLISEALNNSTHSKGAHSKGIMIGGYQGSESGGKGSENISVLNNLMAHNAERNPLMQLCGTAQVINNTTYNPQWTFSHQQLNCTLGESYVNWINNYHKKGPSSTSNSDLKIIPADSGKWSPGKVYVEGNIGPNRPNDTLAETKWVEVKSGAPAGVLVTTPAPAPAVYSVNATEAYNSVIAEGGVGNSRGLNCDGSWYNRRDTIDARVINEVKTGTGKIIDDPSQVGGWIVPAAGAPCADSDHDGMPNVWEQMYGFNPNISDGSGDKDGDGYTNVEEYFNGTTSLNSIPLVISITRASANFTDAASVNFTVVFSKSVTGVDVNDFKLTTSGVSGATVSGVSGSGNVYTVTINTGSGNGTIRLDVVDNNSIVDAASNPLGGNATGDGNFISGETYTIPNVKTYIGGVLQGGYFLHAGESARPSFAGLDDGPVVVRGTSGVKIISAIREAWAVNGVTKSFVQLMGLPAGQLSDQYVFPWYNNVTLNEQLRIGNVDNAASTVTVTIGGVLQGSYTLQPNEAIRINYDGVDSGPLVVQGTPGVQIISAIRDAWAVNGGTTSFSQLMGLPAGQLSNKYVFPAYNNVTLDEQLRIANVDTVASTVTVTIGGILRGTYTLQPGEAVRINYAGVDSGPVVVQGTVGVNIISVIREAWAVNGVTQSFVQLMGLPAGQLSTTYWFPAYNNITLNEQLRFAVP